MQLGRALRRLVLRVASELLGEPAKTTTEPEWHSEARAKAGGLGRTRTDPAAQARRSSAAQVKAPQGWLETNMMEPHDSAESQQEARAQELIDLRRALRGVVQRLEDALDHLGIEAQRLSDENSRLALVAEKLERRLDMMARSLDREDREDREEQEERESTAEPREALAKEPQFRPGDEAVSIEITAVPGFQGLMDVQRGLSALVAVAEANVLRYRNDEAVLEAMLREPLSARQIVEGLQGAIGRQLIIEDARPEALRLRLRFIA